MLNVASIPTSLKRYNGPIEKSGHTEVRSGDLNLLSLEKSLQERLKQQLPYLDPDDLNLLWQSSSSSKSVYSAEARERQEPTIEKRYLSRVDRYRHVSCPAEYGNVFSVMFKTILSHYKDDVPGVIPFSVNHVHKDGSYGVPHPSGRSSTHCNGVSPLHNIGINIKCQCEYYLS